jgi:hypothetical protein
MDKRLRYGQSLMMEHYESDLCNKNLVHIEEVPTSPSGKEQVVKDYLLEFLEFKKQHNRSAIQ